MTFKRSSYNEHEAYDLEVSAEVDAIMAPAVERLYAMAKERNLRIREIMWMASDLVHAMGSEVILREALARHEAKRKRTT